MDHPDGNWTENRPYNSLLFGADLRPRIRHLLSTEAVLIAYRRRFLANAASRDVGLGKGAGMNAPYQPLIARCRLLTGNANAAELLYRIAFWAPKASVKWDGRRWIANERRWWATQTGQSFDQIRRALQ